MTKQEHTNIEILAKSLGESVNTINHLIDVFREKCKVIEHVSETFGNVQVAKDAHAVGVKARNAIPPNYYKNKPKLRKIN
ncbi:hypothetical protein HMPREF9711_03144 [Myroides odoratimimus CCUG 3837]|uniref:hypothetical protein n=1 Tax=Myroides odoratimimus TaxID=76832 RepID=UPI000280ACEF|nr:hypothetical protein [Myroides odoratimimus]EKB02359.1 hypothetical protein HMPREF9711_03144 [Myroides odoratimimus CCUG 3837]